MKVSDNEIIDLILKLLGVGLILFLLKQIARIFKGNDGKFSPAEFGKFIGFFIFTGLGIYMILKEGNRDHEWNLYSETYLFIVFSGMLAVLHLDQALDKFVKMMEIVLKMRSKITTINSEEHTEKTEKKIIDEREL